MSKKWTLVFLLALLPTGMESIVPAPVRADDQCLEQAYNDYQECQDDTWKAIRRGAVTGVVSGAAAGASVGGVGTATGAITGGAMGGLIGGLDHHISCWDNYSSDREECSSADDKSYNKPSSSPAKSSYPDSSYSPYETDYSRDSDGDGSPDQSYDPYFEY